VNSTAMSSVSTAESATRQPSQRLEKESSKAFAAFLAFRDLGPERTYEKVARKLQKSAPLIARWGKRHNWHHRAADWDEHNDREVQRELRSRRIRARKRALDIADKLDEKLAEAVERLEITRVKKEAGKPDVVQSAISPTELAHLFRVSQDVQYRILGKDENENVVEVHYHFTPPDPEFDFERPEVVIAARRKMLQQQKEENPPDPMQGEPEAT
jgi:hypothetical protein